MKGNEYVKRKGKDELPVYTVDKIRNCLKEINLECDMRYYEQDLPGCYSARVYLKGPLSEMIGANGKGTTKEYCMASGFAELMERIQNQIFPYQLRREDIEIFSEENPLPKDSLCKYIPLSDMKKDKNSFLNRIIKKYASSIDNSKSSSYREMLVSMQLESLFPSWEKSGVFTIPFYHVQTGEYEQLPIDLIKSLNLSNGMAAGNTLEEALVQGYSEVFERYAQCKIVLDDLTPPEITRRELQKYPDIFKLVEKIEKSGPYQVIMKDCSLGIELPVVCGIIINLKEQSFGVRFGAHPDIQIAMERVFTEAMQGKQLKDFSKFNKISFSKKNVCSQQNMLNLLKTGEGFYPPSLFGKTASYQYISWDQYIDISNRSLAALMTNQILSECRELYIADMSYLGFPSVCIYAEDMSEIIPATDAVLKANIAKARAESFLQDTSSINREKVQELLTVGRLTRNSVLENTIPSMCKFPISADVHGGNDQIGFLMSVCNYYLGDMEAAARLLRQCLMVNEPGTWEYAYEEVLLKFLQGTCAHMDRQKLAEILCKVCDEQTVHKVLEDFKEPDSVFLKLYPSCIHPRCKECSVSGCAYAPLKDLYKSLYLKMISSRVWTENLHRILGGNV